MRVVNYFSRTIYTTNIIFKLRVNEQGRGWKSICGGPNMFSSTHKTLVASTDYFVLSTSVPIHSPLYSEVLIPIDALDLSPHAPSRYIHPNSHMFVGSTPELSSRLLRAISAFGTSLSKQYDILGSILDKRTDSLVAEQQ